jgi:phosphoglycerol transferase MdoB-like AlkP superfamily enzyme
MVGTRLVALVGYALVVAVAATWPVRDHVELVYPLGTVVSLLVSGLVAAALAGLVSSSDGFLTVAGATGLSMFPVVGAFTYRAAPERAGPEPEYVRAARTVAVGLAVLPAVALLG